MRFEYPIKTENPEMYLGQGNMVGSYPIGRLFNWHGGLHLGEWRNEPIRAIADGVVVAYRITEQPIEINGIKISNSFVLVRHKYISPKGRVFYFYSLYNNLMTYNELKNNDKVPSIFAKEEYVVKGTEKIKGLYLRSSADKEEKMVVPYGMQVVLDNNLTAEEQSDDHWAKQAGNTNYKKVIFTDPFSKEEIRDHFVYIGSAYNKAINSTTYEITAKGAITTDKGENAREVANGNNIKFVIPNGTKVEVNGFTDANNNYYKIKTINGKVCDGLKIFAESVNEVTKKEMITPDVFNEVITGEGNYKAVKAGDIIGWSGCSGFFKQEEYKSCHIEVFSEDDPTEFLTGVAENENTEENGDDKDDVKDTKKYVKIENGASLTLKYP